MLSPKYREIKTFFNFKEQKDKLIVTALVQNVTYQTVILKKPDDKQFFEELKENLNKQFFKVVSKPTENLKLRVVGLPDLEFEKLPQSDLNQRNLQLEKSIKTMSNQNSILAKVNERYRQDLDKFKTTFQNTFKEFRSEFNEVKRQNQQLKAENTKLKKAVEILTDKIKQKEQNRFHRENYVFSHRFKVQDIELFQKNKKAMQMASFDQGRRIGKIVLVDGQVRKKGSFIRFQIQNRQCIVGVGLGIRNIIVDNSYEINSAADAHGYFMMTDHGFGCRHSGSKTRYNNSAFQGEDFRFDSGEIVSVETNEDELIFTNESQNNEVFKMRMILNEEEWNNACFCVMLYDKGDKVKILPLADDARPLDLI